MDRRIESGGFRPIQQTTEQVGVQPDLQFITVETNPRGVIIRTFRPQIDIHTARKLLAMNR